MEDKYNLFDLKEEHKNLLVKYISFFKSKQDRLIKEVKLNIDEFQESNVVDMMYSKSDIHEMFHQVKESVLRSMNEEISYYINMNAIFVQLLLHQADTSNLTLKVETSQVQNLTNVKEMSDFVQQIENQLIPSDLGKGSQLSKLASISKTQNLIFEYENLRHEYDMLRQKYDNLASQNEMLLDEMKNLTQSNDVCAKEINILSAKVSELSMKEASEDDILKINKFQEDLQETKKKLDDEIAKYANLLKEYDKKLSQSSQFLQLKKMLQDKNSLIVELKTKVAKFEEQSNN